MKSVIVVWYEESYRSLEENIPLLWNGRRNKNLGSKNHLTLVFLYGMSDLAPSYLAELQATGYELVDASKVFSQISSKYSTLDKFGNYEKNCFLRWLVLEKLFKGTPIIHYDGDIVWNIPVEEITRNIGRKTFVLDGPAFTAICDASWFTVYRRELEKFAADIESYGSDWDGTDFRNKIGSDQDLISYLLQKKLLPQDKFLPLKHLHIENPLESNPKDWSRLAFWHMQTDFVHYLNLRYMLEPYCLSMYAPNPLKAPKIIIRLIHLLGKISGRKYQSRRQIYNYFFNG